MPNKEYWKSRMETLEDVNHRKGRAYTEHVEKQFRIAQKNIEDKINYWYAKLADNNELTMQGAKRLLRADELEDFHLSIEEYIEKGKTLNYHDTWKKQLENASAKVHISRLEALKMQMQQECEVLYGNMLDGLDGTLRDMYTNSYYHTAYEIMKGHGVGWAFNRLDSRRIENAINTVWANDGKAFSSRVWANKHKLVQELNTVLVQNIIRGESPQRAIAQLAKRMDVSKSRAGTLIMTESAFIHSQSQKDCYKELDVEKLQFVATLDGSTSEICQAMDGVVIDMADYKIGLNVPPLHPRCRSCTVPYFEDEVGERVARGDDGKTYRVPGNMTYKDWKKSFVDGGSKDDLIEIKEPLLAHEIAEIDYRAEKVTFKDLQEWKKAIGNVTDDEYSIISGMNENGYIRTANSYKLNKAMREDAISELSENNQKTIETLKNVIAKNTSDRDAVLIRKVDYEYVKGVYGIDSKNADDIVEELNKKVGVTHTEKGFVSTSYKLDKNLNTNDKIELDIYAPEGTNMFLTRNRDESEIILQARTKFKLEGAVVTDGGNVRIMMRVEPGEMDINAPKKELILTIDDVNNKSSKVLANAYEYHRVKDGLSSVPYDEMGESASLVVGANYGKMSVESAKAFDTALEELVNEYDTPLQKIRTMTKEEFMGNGKAFAFVSHNYSVDSAELVINPTKCKDIDALKDRIKELSERGYAVKIPDEFADKYVATHEFAHTLLNMEQKLNNKTNWLNADYEKIKKARKEILEIHKEYMKEVQALTEKRDSFNDALFDLSSTLEQMEEAAEQWRKYDAMLEEIKLSDYSLENVDEFMAEAFTNEKIGISSKKHSKEVMKVIDKYFKR